MQNIKDSLNQLILPSEDKENQQFHQFNLIKFLENYKRSIDYYNSYDSRFLKNQTKPFQTNSIQLDKLNTLKRQQNSNPKKLFRTTIQQKKISSIIKKHKTMNRSASTYNWNDIKGIHFVPK